MKKIRSYINNKKGNTALVLVLTIVILIAIDMVFGITETSLDVMTINEVKDIIQNVSPDAARVGVTENAHKNESLNERDSYDKAKAKAYFKKEVVNGIERMNFRSKIICTKSKIEDHIDKYTQIKTGKGSWANTWSDVDSSDNKKEVDYVIISTILPLELKNNYSRRDLDKVNRVFKVSNAEGRKNEIDVELKLTDQGLAAFIKVEMKVILT